MMLWIVLTTLCSVAAVLIAVPLIRRFERDHDMSSPDIGVYKDQLTEIERDRGLGLIGQSEAELAKTEIQRRMLAAVKQGSLLRPVSNGWRTAALVAVTALVVLGSVNLYALNGRPDIEASRPAAAATSPAADAVVPAPATAGSGAGDVGSMIERLAAKLEQNPADAEGWRMLGWSYFNTQRYDEAAAAYAKALALVPANSDYKSAYAEALVQAAGGVVIPAAKSIFEAVLKADPKELRSRFYIALAREQAGKLEEALDLWIGLLGDAPADAGWLGDVQQRIGDLGVKTGRDTSALVTGTEPPSATGAAGLAGADQQAAVDAMIAKLAAKLDSNPVDRDGWAMMIRSLKVKGDTAGASQALVKALDVFANDPATRDQILALAKSLGVAPGAVAASAAPVVNADDMAAAAALPAEDQQAMIRGMVDRLAEKLAASPHDAEGWVRLIRSRTVLKEPDLAREALRNALAEFSNDADARAQIAATARGLGVVVD